MAETLDRKTVIEAVRNKFPLATTAEVNEIADNIDTEQDLSDFKKTKLAPAQLSRVDNATATVDATGEDTSNILEDVLMGGVMLVGPGKFLKGIKIGKSVASKAVGGASVVGGLAKTFIPRTASGKINKKSLAKRTAGLGLAGLFVSTFFGAEDADTEAIANQSAQDLAQQNLLMNLGQYQLQGGDINALAGTAAGQQLFSGSGLDIKSIMGTSTLPSMGGVYVGPTGKTGLAGPMIPFKTGLAQGEKELTTIPMTEWKNQFPINDPQKLQNWKTTLVNSGVVSADAGLGELQKQWDAWGQLSMESARKGQNLTPYQLLDINRGLWGGGSGGPSYSVSLMKEENARTLLKQAMEAYSGQIVSDEEADAFAKTIRKKQLTTPTKTETKNVGGKRVSVTTQGFGEAEAAALAKEQAKKSPMYEEFQTANVFGSALEKALGVRG
jgi:hypothetical protein